MTDQKLPKNEQFDEGFNEDFDFGENQPEIRTTQSGSKPGLNKKILASLVTIVLGIILGVGYKFYSPLSTLLSEPTAQTTNAPIKTTTPIQAQVVLPQKITPPQATPVPTYTPPPVAPAVAMEEAQTPATTVAGSDPPMTDIAEAFSATDLPASAATNPATMPPSNNGAAMTIQPVATNPVATNPAPAGPATKTPLKSPNTTRVTTPAVNAANTQTTNPATENQLNVSISQLNQGLTKLNQQVDDIVNQIKYLDSYNHTMSDNLNKLNDSISMVDQRLSTLSSTTSVLSKDVGSVKTEMGQVKEVLKEDGLGPNTSSSPSYQGQENRGDFGDASRINIEEPEYRVHAIIPGRAWLKSSKGQIITVAEGDTIGNYGKILVIDAANSVVLTSSGIAFR